MANTYSQLYIHFIFGVRGKGALIPVAHKEELHKYMTGILRNRDTKVYAINSMPDHLHVLVSMKPDTSPSILMRELKAISSKWINEKKWTGGLKFRWQVGYAALSHGQAELRTVIEYIEGQEEHHAKRSLKSEYLAFLKRYEIEYDPRYVFDEENGEGSSRRD